MLEEGRQNVYSDIVRPSTVDELQDFVKEAARRGRSMRLQGGGTHQRFGNLGRETDMHLELTNLDQVIDYSPVDLTLAVEAGVALATIDNLLAENGQRLPLDAPNRDQATIGGTFAVGLSGPRRLRYGALKDMVIGSEIVNSRAELTKSGGMVVKNVSGYELSRLHYGAHGAFGIVRRLNLKVLPAPESRVEVVSRFDNVGDCLHAATAVLTSAMDPAAVYVERIAAGWSLYVQIEGSERFTETQSGRIAAELDRESIPDATEVIRIEGNSTPAFDRAVDLQRRVDDLVVRLSVPASRQPNVLEALAGWNVRYLFADVGSGLIYIHMEGSHAALKNIQALGCPYTILAAPDDLRRDLDVFGHTEPGEAALLSRLKDEYDPERLFNPGRFVSFL